MHPTIYHQPGSAFTMRMNEALEYVENQEIARLIQERTAQPYKTLTHDEMLEHLGISEDELK